MEWDEDLIRLMHIRSVYLHMKYTLPSKVICEDVPYKHRFIPPAILDVVGLEIDQRLQELTREIDKYEVKKNETETIKRHAPEKAIVAPAETKPRQAKRGSGSRLPS